MAVGDPDRRICPPGPEARRTIEFTIMSEKRDVTPDTTAEQVALWRARHLEIDPPPHVLEDEIGLKLLAPDQEWRQRTPHSANRSHHIACDPGGLHHRYARI